MSYSLVQNVVDTSDTGGTGVSSHTLTIAAMGSGNTGKGAVCWYYGSSGATSCTVKFGSSDTATVVDTLTTADNQALATFFLSNVTDAPTSVVISFSGGGGTGLGRFVIASFIEETSSPLVIETIDQHTIQYQTGLTNNATITSGNITPSIAGETLYGAASLTNADTADYTGTGNVTSGWTGANSSGVTTGAQLLLDEYQTDSNANPVGSGWSNQTTIGPSNFIAAIISAQPQTAAQIGAALALSGSLAGNVLPQQFVGASFSGAGTIAGNVIPEQFIAASLPGAGAMAAQFLEIDKMRGSLLPIGSMTVPLVESDIILANFAPAGSLTAQVIGGQFWPLSSSLGITANLSRIIAQGELLAAIPTMLAGAGGLSANALGPWQFVPASLTPSGNLSLSLLLREAFAALLAGAGNLSVQPNLLSGHIQGVIGALGAASGATSATATGLSTISVGSTVIGAAIAAGADHFVNVTDDQGNTYPVLLTVTDGSNGAFLHVFGLADITNGPQTLAANYASPGVGTPQICWDEYALAAAGSIGVSAGQAVQNPGTATDAITSGNLTTTRASTLWGVTASYAGSTSGVPGTNFVGREQDSATGHWGIVTEDEYLAAPGAYAATFTSSVGLNYWATAAVTFSTSSQLLAASLTPVGGLTGAPIASELTYAQLAAAANMTAPTISRLVPSGSSLSLSGKLVHYWNQQFSAQLNGIAAALNSPDLRPIYPQIAANYAPAMSMAALAQPLILAIPATLGSQVNMGAAAMLQAASPASHNIVASMVHTWPSAPPLGGAIGEQTIGDEPLGWDVFGNVWQLATAFSPSVALTADVQPLHSGGVLWQTAASLVPAGTMSASLLLDEQMTSALSPAGSLVASLLETEQLVASFVGTGALTADVRHFAPLAAALSPTGALTAVITPPQLLSAFLSTVFLDTGSLIEWAQVVAALSPAGIMNARLIERARIAATFTPAGTLFANIPGKTGSGFIANFAPVGSLSASIPVWTTASPMAIAGSLTAIPPLWAAIVESFAGAGLLAANILPSQLYPNAMSVQTRLMASLFAEDYAAMAMAIVGKLFAYLGAITSQDFAATAIPGFVAAPVGPSAPTSSGDIASAIWVRRITDVVNNMLLGKLNVTIQVTLSANATSTTIIDARIGVFSVIMLMPVTQNAAAIGNSVWVSSQQDGQATITHPDTINVDQNFRVMIVG